MRVRIAAIAVLGFGMPAARAVDESPWAEAVALRGPHQAVFQKVSSQVLPNGRPIYRTNSFTSLGTGMHAWDGQGWIPADDRIELVPGGAVGQRTAHKVFFFR